MTKVKFVTNKQTIKVKMNPITRQIDDVQKSTIKNQVQNTPIEFTLDRDVDFGEF